MTSTVRVSTGSLALRDYSCDTEDEARELADDLAATIPASREDIGVDIIENGDGE